MNEEKSFEEQFPTLELGGISKEALMVSKQMIKEHCLDKQKVRDAIEKATHEWRDGKYTDYHKLKTELGL